MKILFKFGEELFWTAFWVILSLIAGFFVLNALSNKFQGTIVGDAAEWTADRASNQ